MSTFFANCPLPTELPCIPAQDCPVKWGQIQKLAFQRRAGNPAFNGTNSIAQQASWTAAMSASGANRVLVSPFLNNFVIPYGEVNFDGGDTNETLNGAAVYKGNAPVTVTGYLVNAAPSVVAAMRKLAMFSHTAGLSDLEVFMFNERGDIICRNTGTTTTPVYRGILVYNLAVGTVGTEGLGTDNRNNVSFQFVGAWDEDLATINTYNVTPKWSPLELDNTCV